MMMAETIQKQKTKNKKRTSKMNLFPPFSSFLVLFNRDVTFFVMFVCFFFQW